MIKARVVTRTGTISSDKYYAIGVIYGHKEIILQTPEFYYPEDAETFLQKIVDKLNKES